jgi:hypothetical protein
MESPNALLRRFGRLAVCAFAEPESRGPSVAAAPGGRDPAACPGALEIKTCRHLLNCPNLSVSVHSDSAEGGNRPLVVGTTSARPSGPTIPGGLSVFAAGRASAPGRRVGHFAAAVSLILGCSRLARVYCACRTATGRTSNNSDAASVGPVIALPPASTLLIAEKPSVATDAFQAPPAGHLLPLSVARPKRRPVTTITAFRPANRAKATISLRCGPVVASGR